MSGDACSGENTHNYQATHAVEKHKNLKIEHACSRENMSNRCQGIQAVEKPQLLATLKVTGNALSARALRNDPP